MPGKARQDLGVGQAGRAATPQIATGMHVGSAVGLGDGSIGSGDGSDPRILQLSPVKVARPCGSTGVILGTRQ